MNEDDPKIHYFSIAELDRNAWDPGYMFCEDCHCEHKIYYMNGDTTKLDGTNGKIFLGYYTCKDEDHIWSINGKRVD